jgi:hypothetical protein
MVEVDAGTVFVTVCATRTYLHGFDQGTDQRGHLVLHHIRIGLLSAIVLWTRSVCLPFGIHLQFGTVS